MPHFFINSKSVNNNQIVVDDELNYQHIVKSLRTQIGEQLKLIDETETEYITIVQDITKNTIVAEIKNTYKSNRKLKFDLYLAQSPLRSASQLTVVEKATELGVKGIYPVYTDNCSLKKLVIDKKIEKWQNVMYSASKQCERADIPICFPLSSLDETIQSQKFDKIIALCESDTEMSLKLFLEDNKINRNDKVLVIIGPEGGFSNNEFKYFKTHSIPRISLGNLILKAETAVIVALGNIIYEFR